MALNGDVHMGGQHFTLLAPLTIGAALTNTVSTAAQTCTNISGMNSLTVLAKFLYGAGGTTVRAWIQTSHDSGASWMDIMVFNFTTAAKSLVYVNTSNPATPVPVTIQPGDAALTVDAVVNGILGERVRFKLTTTGTYTGASSLALFMIARA